MVILRWTAAGVLEAERHFPQGCGLSTKLVAALATAASEMIVGIESTS